MAQNRTTKTKCTGQIVTLARTGTLRLAIATSISITAAIAIAIATAIAIARVQAQRRAIVGSNDLGSLFSETVGRRHHVGSPLVDWIE